MFPRAVIQSPKLSVAPQPHRAHGQNSRVHQRIHGQNSGLLVHLYGKNYILLTLTQDVSFPLILNVGKNYRSICSTCTFVANRNHRFFFLSSLLLPSFQRIIYTQRSFKVAVVIRPASRSYILIQNKDKNKKLIVVGSFRMAPSFPALMPLCNPLPMNRVWQK